MVELNRIRSPSLASRSRTRGWRLDSLLVLEAVAFDEAIECSLGVPATHAWPLLAGSLAACSRHWPSCAPSSVAYVAMIFKLAQAAEESWHRLRGHDQLPKVICGVKFNDGIEVIRSQAQTAAA
jgi:hypothetical protein